MPAPTSSLATHNPLWLPSVLVLASAIAPTACASRSTSGEAAAKAVQEELARLRAEQASLQHRVETLEAAAEASPRASLPVVKLVPEPNAAVSASDLSSSTALNVPPASDATENEERLVITGTGDNLKTTSSKAKARDPVPAPR